MVVGPSEHHPGLRSEIAGLSVDSAQAVHAWLGELRRTLNVYRGTLSRSVLLPWAESSLEFGRSRRSLGGRRASRGGARAGERHALGVAAHRDALLEAGQHLKRGLLLYGPPGTGKTHTTRYLVAQMDGYTRLLLTGTGAAGNRRRGGARA